MHPFRNPLTPAQLSKLQGFRPPPPPPKQKRRKGGALTLAIIAAMHAEGLRRISPHDLWTRIELLGETGKWPKVRSVDGARKVCGDLLGEHYASLTPIEEIDGGTVREIPDDFDPTTWAQKHDLDTTV